MEINKQTIRCCGAGQTNLNSLPPLAKDRASYLLGDKTFFLDLAKPDLAKPDLAKPDLAKPDLAKLQFSSIHLEL